jgi:hypothetical protein
MFGKNISVSFRRKKVEVMATQGPFFYNKVAYLATLKQFPCSSSS